MRVSRSTCWRAITVLAGIGLTVASPASGWGQPPQQPRSFEPQVGQSGKDVVWVPTPAALVEKMLDMAQVTEDDLVMDLGSGDGRTIIAAARRGARAVGVEFDPNMVNLSRRLAEEAGVATRATFVEGDMYTADISKATVMALFLLPPNLERLREAFFALAPGTRLVLNTFAIPGWEPDAQETIGNCVAWCTSLLYVVPARVQGRWKTARGELVLDQKFQVVSGTLTAAGAPTPVTGRLRGTELELVVGADTLRGNVTGDRIEGALSGVRAPTP